MYMRMLLIVVGMVMSGLATSAQQIPQPSGPVVFCGTQATPIADSYQLVFNGGAPEALTMDATMDPACPAGNTNSFRLPASRFTVGSHTLKVIATNAFGATDGPAYSVVVGIRPGQFTITAIVSGGGQ